MSTPETTPDPETSHPTPARRRWPLLILVLGISVPALIFATLGVLSQWGRTIDRRMPPALAINIVLQGLHDFPQTSVPILAHSAGGIDEPLYLADQHLTVGTASNSDDHRTLIIYYTKPDNADAVPHSVMLIDTQTRTTTWPMLDPAKMNEYFAAAASQAEGLIASSRGVERSDTPGNAP